MSTSTEQELSNFMPEFSPGSRMHIRMSKVNRDLQSANILSNWAEMVKILFFAETDQGRRDETAKLLAERCEKILPKRDGASYNADQLQYFLRLLLIVLTAETRTEIMYQQNFANRCDSISRANNLPDSDYWTDEQVPEDWLVLNAEFERKSLEILLNTLTEYNQHDVADLVRREGPDQLFDIIRSVQAQFRKILQQASSGISQESQTGTGSIPETLQPSNFKFLNERKAGQ